MKFWVRAVTDTAAEQLLVDADDAEELRAQLEALLHCGPIARTSITDFSGQVVAKLNSGADIIQVRVECTAPPAALGPPAEEALSVSPRPGRRLSGSGIAAHAAESPARDLERSGGGGGGGSTPRHRRHPDDGADHSVHGATAASNGGSSGGRVHRTGSGKGRALMGDGADVGRVTGVVIKRADLAQLIDATFSSAFDEAVCGCFVRIREGAFGGRDSSGYIIAQIASVHSPTQIVVDLIHLIEMRHLDVVSNTAASADEIRAWYRKIVAASHTPPSAVFLEAKQEALQAALREAASMHTPAPPPPPLSSNGIGSTPPNTLRRRATVFNLAGLAATATAHETSAGSVSCPSARSSSSGGGPLLAPPEEQRPVIGRPLHPGTNDRLLSCAVCRANDTDQWCVVGARHSNAKNRHTRPRDFSGCLVVAADDFSDVLEDRDVTVKGVFPSTGAPQLWRGYFHLAAQRLTAAHPVPLSLRSVRNQKSLHSGEGIAAEGQDAPGAAVAAEHIALVGRDIKALYNAPLPLALPSVPWAPFATLHSPQLLAHAELLHLFFIAEFEGDGERVQGIAHAVTRDARMQEWALVTQDGPLTQGRGGTCFHASPCSLLPASPDGTATAPTLNAIRLAVCTACASDEPAVTILHNSDPEFSERRWTPTASVCAIPQGGWRSGGIQSVSVFTYADERAYVVLTGLENVRHSTVMIVPLVQSS